MTPKQKEAKREASKRCIARKKAKSLVDNGNKIPNDIWNDMWVGLTKEQVWKFKSKNTWINDCGKSTSITLPSPPPPLTKSTTKYVRGDLILDTNSALGVILESNRSGAYPYTFSKNNTTYKINDDGIVAKVGTVDMENWKDAMSSVKTSPRGSAWNGLIPGESLILTTGNRVARFMGYKARNTKYPLIVKYLTGSIAHNGKTYKAARSTFVKEITETEFKLMQIK